MPHVETWGEQMVREEEEDGTYSSFSDSTDSGRGDGIKLGPKPTFDLLPHQEVELHLLNCCQKCKSNMFETNAEQCFKDCIKFKITNLPEKHMKCFIKHYPPDEEEKWGCRVPCCPIF